MKCLRLLVFVGYNCIDDEGVRVLGGMGGLKHLTFNRCGGITDEGLRYVVNVEEFGVENCSGVTGGGIGYVCGGGLKKLSLAKSKCHIVMDFRLWSIGLTGLRALDLSMCECVDDRDMCAISELKLLEKLDVSWCKRVGDLGVYSLSRMGSLRDLDISGCGRVTRDGLREICGMKGLRVLSFCYNNVVTFSSVALFCSLERLRKLNIYGCDVDKNDVDVISMRKRGVDVGM